MLPVFLTAQYFACTLSFYFSLFHVLSIVSFVFSLSPFAVHFIFSLENFYKFFLSPLLFLCFSFLHACCFNLISLLSSSNYLCLWPVSLFHSPLIPPSFTLLVLFVPFSLLSTFALSPFLSLLLFLTHTLSCPHFVSLSSPPPLLSFLSLSPFSLSHPIPSHLSFSLCSFCMQLSHIPMHEFTTTGFRWSKVNNHHKSSLTILYHRPFMSSPLSFIVLHTFLFNSMMGS